MTIIKDMKSCCWHLVIVCALQQLIDYSICNPVQMEVSFYLPEESPPNTPVGLLPRNGTLRQLESNKPPSSYFNISDGLICSTKTFDRESLSTDSVKNGYKFLVTLEDEKAVLIEVYTVHVFIADINDNTPQFPMPLLNVSVSESVSVGYSVALPLASDKDAGSNGTIVYSIGSQEKFSYFSVVHAKKGQDESLLLVTQAVIDREAQSDSHHVRVLACDHGKPPRCGSLLVNVDIIDANDNGPVFEKTLYSVLVYENFTVGQSVVTVKATDADSGSNGLIRYSVFNSADPLGQFAASTLQNGDINVVNLKLDAERQFLYTLLVIAEDGGDPPRKATATVKVTVLDCNDNAPKIFVERTNIKDGWSIIEGDPVGFEVARITVTDDDKDMANNQISRVFFNDSSGNLGIRFIKDVNKREFIYSVFTEVVLDREKTGTTLKFSITAYDNGFPVLHSTVDSEIYVGDVNDNAPTFQESVFIAHVNETAHIGEIIMKVSASDLDFGLNSKLKYDLMPSPFSSWFEVNNNTGEISVIGKIDHEAVATVNVTVIAVDGGSPPRNGTCLVMVEILDANDNAPFFETEVVNFSVLENEDAGKVIGTVSASDKDVVGTQELRYSIQNMTSFSIDQITGVIRTQERFDREFVNVYRFDVLATDGGGLTGRVTVIVSVLDVNDYAPRFPELIYTIPVHENSFVGRVFAYVTAVDLDEGTNAALVYSKSVDDMFSVVSSTGGITLLKKLDRSMARLYKFNLSVQDRGGLQGLNTAQVNVEVLPASTVAPVFDKTSYAFSLSESAAIGYVLGPVIARRKDSATTAFLDYAIVSGNVGNAFLLDEKGTLSVVASLDYERVVSYDIRVTVVDALDLSLAANASVVISVLDENDNSPTFTASKFFVDVSESVPVGYTIHRCVASDIDSGSNGKVSYSIVNSTSSLISIDAGSGEIFITRSLDYEEVRTYDVHVRAADGGLPQRSSVARLFINVIDENDNAPVFRKDRYTVHVPEDTQVGSTLVTMEGADADSGRNGQFSFHLNPSSDAKAFRIMSTGELVLERPVDRESKAYYSFVCVVRDHGQPSRQSQTRIHIVVDDVNDESPVFEEAAYKFRLQEEQPPGQVIGHLVATDADTGSNGIFTYSLKEPSKLFAVETSDLVFPAKTVCVVQSLVQFDREKSEAAYSFTVVATDQGVPRKSTEVIVTVSIENINDVPPRFPQETPFLVFVEHGTDVGSVVTTISARDEDVQPYPLRYKLVAFTEEEKKTLEFVDIHQADTFKGYVKVKKQFPASVKPFLEATVCVEESVDLDPYFNYQKLVIFTGPKIAHKVLQTSSVEIPISEKTKVDSYIYTVQVSSIYRDTDWSWKYRIENEDVDDIPFKIDKHRGVITTAMPLLHRLHYQLRVEASGLLNGSPYAESMFVNVYVIMENLFPPQYPRNPVVLSVREDWMPYLRYPDKLDNATDSDLGMNGKCMFSLVSATPERSPFKISPLTGEIIFTTWMDREKYDAFVLIAQVSDLAVNISQRLTTTFTIHLLVFDVNDNYPTFTSVNSTYVFEDDQPGTVVANIKAHDPDVGQTHADVIYQIIKGNEEGKFDIDLETGLLKTSNFLDISVTAHYVLTILAQEVRTEKELKLFGISSLNSTTQVSIEVVDVNDKQPNFTRKMYEASVREDASLHSVVLFVTATDDDFGTNAEMEYGLTDSSDVFSINRSSGAISLKHALDRESQDLYTIHVTVKNTVYPFYLDSATVTITVLDVNDFAPVFSDGPSVSIFILENSPAGVVHTFLVTDVDIGSNAEVAFNMAPESMTSTFSLDKKKGTLSTLHSLDREVMDEYLFTVTARNTENPYHATSQSVKIVVGDVNDEPPRFIRKSFYAEVAEDKPMKVPILTVKAVDKDIGSNAIIIYSLPLSIEGNFGIDPDSGDVFLVSPLDYEGTTTYSFSVKALGSQGSQSDEAQVTIVVLDRNDNAPKFSQSVYEVLIQRPQASVTILQVLATDADEGGKQGVTYSLEPASHGFAINKGSGEIKIANSSLTPGQYRLHVKAEDLGYPALQNWAQVFVAIGNPDKDLLKFVNSSVNFRLEENPPQGYRLGRLVAAATSGDPVSYSIVQTSNPDSAFAVDLLSGDLYVNNSDAVDYELHPSFLLGIVATIAGIGPRSSYLTVAVALSDVNDNDPQILPTYSKFKYTETNQVNFQPTYLHSFLVSDKDKLDDGKLRIELISGNDNGDFQVDPSLFWLLVVNNIDYERQREYSLVVRVTDGGNPVRFSESNIVIEVEDQNDNPPVFQALQPVFVSEATKVGAIVANITTIDADVTKSETTYDVQRQAPKNASFFYIDKSKGSLSLARPLDYETQKQHVVNISAYDGVHTTYGSLIINVMDVNDFEPIFSHSVYELSVQETVPINQYLGQVLATDRDSGEFGHVQYKLDPPQDAFTIDQESGRVYASKEITFRKGVEPYRLTVVAFDSGGQTGSRNTSASVYLRVSNTVSVSPAFEKRTFLFAISESSATGSFVGTVAASLEFTVPRTLVYEISSVGSGALPFVVDKFKGIISVNNKLDRETVDHYTFKIEVRVHNDPSVIPGECSVEVKIEDANDNPPVFAENEYTVTVRENLPEKSVLLQVQATDADEPNTLNSRIRYAIHSGQDKIEYLHIHPRTGWVKAQKILDREFSPELRLTIRATDYDGKGLTSFASLVVKLLDENDNSPIFEFNAPNLNQLKVDENKPANTTVFKATATDKDAGKNGLVEYRIINGTGFNLFRIVHSTGWVFTNDVFDYEKESLYTLIVLAQDHGDPPRATSFEYRIAINDVNEFRPRFDKDVESFVVPASAEVGSFVGSVIAYDADKGPAGVVHYVFVPPYSDELFIEELSGKIFVNADLRRRTSSRNRRKNGSEVSEPSNLRYTVQANNGPNTTLTDTVEVHVAVNYSCPGCMMASSESSGSTFKATTLVVVLVSLAVFAVILFLFCAFIYCRRKGSRRGRTPSPLYAVQKPHLAGSASFERECLHSTGSSREPLHGQFFTDFVVPAGSHVRESSESDFLNEKAHSNSASVTDKGSTHSFGVYHEQSVPDSGIQPDFGFRVKDISMKDLKSDSVFSKALSDFSASLQMSNGSAFSHNASKRSANRLTPSVGRMTPSMGGITSSLKVGSQLTRISLPNGSHESLNDFKEEGGGEAAGGMDVGNLLYAKLAEVHADEHEAIMDGTRPFHDEGMPSHGGSLSTIITSDDEITAAYQWDRMKNWRPAYNPVPSAFSDVGQRKVSDHRSGPLDTSSGAQARYGSQDQVRQNFVNCINFKNDLRATPMAHGSSSTARNCPSMVPPATVQKQQSDIDSRTGRARNALPPAKRPVAAVSPEEVPMANLMSNTTSLLSSMTSLPRSPQSLHSSYTSAVVSPNITPALTPHVLRSPSVSSLGSPEDYFSGTPLSKGPLPGIGAQRRGSGGSRRSNSSRITLSDLNPSESEIDV